VNDVEDLEQVLTTRYEFESVQIKKLLNEQATHKAVIDAFQKHLIAQATKETVVLFFYSGHGSQMKDREQEEPDGWDETICPYDTRVGKTFDISDDEIAGLLSQLLKKTSNVTLIFDSCHSGSMSRGPAVARMGPRDERDPPTAPIYAIAAKGFADSSVAFGQSQTMLFACRSDQLSYEMKYDGAVHGSFTYNLVQQLRAADRKMTLRDILEQVKAHVAVDIGNQQPNAEGNLDRPPFGGAITTQEPYFLVHREGDQVSLSAGLVHGLTPDSRFDVFPPGTKTFKEPRLGQVRLSNVSAFNSQAEIVEKTGEIPDLARAIEREHSFRGNPFRVSMQVTSDQLREQVVAGIKMVGGVEQALTPGDGAVLFSEIGDQLKLLDPSATVEFASIPKAGITPELISKTVRRWSSWILAVRTSNPTAVFKGIFSVTRPQNSKEAKGWFTPEQTFRNGDEIEICVKNASDQPWFFTLLDFSSDGSISQVYPPAGGLPEPLAAQGEWKRTTTVSIPVGKKRVRDVLKVIFSQQPVDFSPLLAYTPSRSEPNQFLRAVAPIGTGKPEKWVTSERIFDVISSDR
jgi:hypothetical protein